MSWERAEKMAEEQKKRSGKYVKLPNEGDKVVGAFLGAPSGRAVFWNGAKYEPFDAKTHDEEKMLARFSFNFYDLDSDKLKIVDLPSGAFNRVLQCKEKYGLEECAYEIVREIVGGKKRLALLFDRKLTDEEKEKLAKVELRDLGGKVIEGAEAQEEDVPF